DTGIGMKKAELEENIGTIAKSGTLAFKDETEMEEDFDIKGQFGVGFYAAIMVADTVTVRSRAFGHDEAYEWKKEGAEGSTNTEKERLNIMVTIWRKNKSELSDEDYVNFYKEKGYGFDEPLKHIHTNVDGNIRYHAILYVPSTMPFDFYSADYEKGLELYSNGVLIMNKAPELLPDYFSFVKGMVDSEDLSLNISREMLQHDRQLKMIEKNITRKIKQALQGMLKNDRETYLQFYE